MKWLGACVLGMWLVAPASATQWVDLAGPTSSVRVGLQQVSPVTAPERANDGVLQRRYVFQPSPHPQLTIRPDAGTWNWRGQGELHLRLQNAMPWAVTVQIAVDSGSGQHLDTTVGVPAGPPQTVVVPLHAISPRRFGMQVGPLMPFDDHGQPMLLATTVRGAIDLAAVHAVRLSIPAPQAAQTLLLGRLGTVPGDAVLHAAYADIVDRYGQYTRGSWPQKIASDAALRAAHAKAAAALKAELAESGKDLDVYGGLRNVLLRRTGWFHTQKRDGRWWLVTPDGHGFFSLGVNAVAAQQVRSYVQGRAYMFRDLPPDSGPWAAFWGRGDDRRPDSGASAGMGDNHGRWFDFYAANLYRIDGPGWLDAWRRLTLERLKAWGFNTLGNWSDPALGVMHRLAYTLPINIRGDFAHVSSGYDYWGRMPDPFDPRFAQAAAAAVAKATRGVRNDPWLLGYFADNELAWASIGPQGRWGLALGTLRGGPRSPAKQAFIADLEKEYGTPQKLAAAWGIALGAWQALDAAGFAAPLPDAAHPAIAGDYSAWLRRYADTYFRIVAQAIHHDDPHHLFLGGRFAVNTPEAVAACARYCDVVSFNIYADLPQHGFDEAALRRLDKPVLITEFHFGSDDRGPFGKGVASVWTEAQRGQAYARYVQAAAADPLIVGAHWFEYVDEPVAGRLLDGENSHIGLVGVTDLPFAGFVKAVRQTNRRVQDGLGRH
ncbi:beta-agarase [Dyella sp. A6]|uniref:beta-agarase n=1 Tax=Dyella aluminiiresistens TaxID=3069105 RepID=UPI002E792A39|nr:beta-agarase [Dyella sp. A6]